jgi:uncharacterized protein YndB with AHSA1/START domain
MTVAAQDAPTTDRIEKHVVVRASRSRVWRAISTAREFGTWFGMKIEEEFAEGTTVRGKLVYRGVEHVIEMMIERIDPERYFSYRWHPYAIDPAVDYSAEPTTLVEFMLDETDEGTAVRIVESGFDQIPLSRRAEAFRMNDQGWVSQIKNLERYVS